MVFWEKSFLATLVGLLPGLICSLRTWCAICPMELRRWRSTVRISGSASISPRLDGVESGSAALKYGGYGFGHLLITGGIGVNHIAFQRVVTQNAC